MNSILNSAEQRHLVSFINVKLVLLGCAPIQTPELVDHTDIVSSFAAQYQEKERLLGQYLCPADQRIQTFLDGYLSGLPAPRLPIRTLTLDRPGLARILSLPVDRDEFTSELVTSYRVKQGVLHNPKHDRRTTAGVFHVAEGGLPIPDDKRRVPKAVFAKMLELAWQPPKALLRLPFTATQRQPAECFVSLLLRPLVCPAVPRVTTEKTMEVRFFAPGGLVSNLDFVESIFGNAGDPLLPENDAGLDSEHWTGHTGCVILAPHLTQLTKQAAGLPHWDHATERQRHDGMCWRRETERYNEGEAFKLTCRDEQGVIVTIIADNYFGYCKKEIKTQISYAANLFGGCEEEHAGGALTFAAYNLGEKFSGDLHVRPLGHNMEEVFRLYADLMEIQPGGYGIDKRFPNIVYVPQNAEFDLLAQRITWKNQTGTHAIKLLARQTYVRPSGYKVRMEKPAGPGRPWRLVGITAEGVFCHKPCTVSGGGKSEISKPITDAVLTGPVFVADWKKDLDQVAELIERDYSDRFKDKSRKDRRKILSAERSLGSVIKLLTQDQRDFTPEYNAWLERIPRYLKELVFVIKRYYQPAWGADWRDHFSVDIINGTPGNELKCDNHQLVTIHLRVGFDDDGAWRTFGLRKDYYPAVKIQVEDDITASVVVPRTHLTPLPEPAEAPSVKFVGNCERRLFQRPDDAIRRGYDQQAERDFAQPDNFFSNYEPLPAARASELMEDSIGFSEYTEPMQGVIRTMATERSGYFVSTAHPRLVNGVPSRNPRYLQVRPDWQSPQEVYLAEVGMRLRRRLPLSQPVYKPVEAVLPGRRNNPPDGRIRPLTVYNPIHYLELPELFMEFICSITGKSPSTTGAGSEGALTKGPFNALPSIMDLNNALVSFLLTGSQGFVTAAGYVGPKFRVDHDISLIVPEVWCHLSPEERSPQFLIANGYLDPCVDFEYQGRPVLASRLGYRINIRFVHYFFARVFNHPHTIFTEAMLKPELQDMDVFVDAMDNIVATHQRVAQMYFDDGTIAQACPPLRALLHLMRDGQWEGLELHHPQVRQLFTREQLLSSDWYAARLQAKQHVDRQLLRRHQGYLSQFLQRPGYADEAQRLGLRDRLAQVQAQLLAVEAPDYWQKLTGTLGAEPITNYLGPQAASTSQPRG
ncbi:MAG TPA: hypothetical protein PKN95_10000 [Verrucomicrobiota bacterium]|nr:hypothetical protein [Verrucomicrobiota bacterium]HNT14788.1 hypothetical protein [Verrucomicrobiota bacterium]